MIDVTKRNLKRLASLSALGAGALGITTGTADASSIVFSGILDEKVGFSPGFHNRATFTGPNGVGGILRAISSASSGGTTARVALRNKEGRHGTSFRFLAAEGSISFRSSFARAFRSGVEWRSAGGAAGPARGGACAGAVGNNKTVYQGALAGSVRACFFNSSFTFFNSTDKYLLFEFSGGRLAEPLYGWAQIDAKFVKDRADVTLVDWAYDTSGAEIPAGDTGTPEPSTFALTGLAALALGAKGLRSWRAARAKAAAS